MRLPTLLATASAAALIAVAAIAQDAPPAEAPAEKTEQPAAAPGLSELNDTVRTLEDQPVPAEAAPEAQPAPTPAPETPAPAPAPETPAPAPAPETPAPTPQPAPQAGPPAPPPPPLTRAQRAGLAEVAARGRLLGVIARAGILATQDMLSRISDPAGAGITGWIAEPEGNGVTVTFYADGADGAAPAAVYRVNILGGRVQGREVFLGASRPPLGPIQRRMAAARAAASAQAHQPCGAEAFNVFVVPPAAPDGPIDVYQVSAQTQRGRYPLGGHFRTRVGADGNVVETRGFSNACLDTAVADPAPGTPPAPLALTHLLDPLPTEIHVFLSIWTGHPLVVVAGDPQRLFAVTPEGIAEIPR